MKRTRIDTAEFIKVWQASSSVADVAEKFGIKSNHASSKAAGLRKAGVTNLKVMPRSGGGPRVNYSELNKLAKASLKETK